MYRSVKAIAKAIERSSIRGVQLFPELIEILILTFADDLALISDTVIGLQRLLNLLHNFCKVKDLIVNTIKTKVMVYRNGGMLAKTEHWTYGGEVLEVVLCFTYLGLSFTRQLSLTQMACEQAIKGKRILVPILSKLYKYGQMSNEVFFRIFDSKISPVLMYGTEIWGTDYQQAVERVHYYACKRYMCVRLNSINDVVLGECGRFPMYIVANKRCLNYRLKIMRMPDDRYVKNVT